MASTGLQGMEPTRPGSTCACTSPTLLGGALSRRGGDLFFSCFTSRNILSDNAHNAPLGRSRPRRESRNTTRHYFLLVASTDGPPFPSSRNCVMSLMRIIKVVMVVVIVVVVVVLLLQLVVLWKRGLKLSDSDAASQHKRRGNTFRHLKMPFFQPERR